MPGQKVTHGIGRLAQRIGLADDRSELAGFDEPGEGLQVGEAVSGDERGEPLPS